MRKNLYHPINLCVQWKWGGPGDRFYLEAPESSEKKLELILEFLIEISVLSFYSVYYAQTYAPVYTVLFYNDTNIHSPSGSKMCLSFQKEEIK